MLRLRKPLILLLLFFAFATAMAQTTVVKPESTLQKQLRELKGVVDVKPLKFQKPFTEKYLVMLTQWIDPNDTTAGTFVQRVFLSHLSLDAPMVVVTEGYAGDYAAMTGYTEELADIFGTNQILIEHRYFGESIPKVLDWKYLTAANAAADHHRVVTLFKSLYKKKWIATGISKGGETAMIYRVMYPDDVDATVCYVAPLCFSVEDGRHEPFICCSVSDAAARAKVQAFQMEVMKRKNKILPLFKEYCDQMKYTFRLSTSEIYDYCVLEFSFSFWQWGWKTSTIPTDQASDKDLFNYLIRVCSPDYFAVEGMEANKAFYVQAAKELGYYGYDVSPFSKYMKVKSATGYLQKIFLGEDLKFTFDSTLSKRCATYLKENDPHMVFVYGEFDPWSAAAVQFSDKKNMYRAVVKGGSHSSRINSLDAVQKAEILDRIKRWIE
jgi:hypothetical protein